MRSERERPARSLVAAQVRLTYLSALLLSTDPDDKENACLAIAAIAQDSSENRAALFEHGVSKQALPPTTNSSAHRPPHHHHTACIATHGAAHRLPHRLPHLAVVHWVARDCTT